MSIRTEQPPDPTPVRAVNEAAFETPAEADLVDALRAQADPYISLVAEHDGAVIGHIMFSPVELPDHSGLKAMGLGPMAVAPEHQRRGIGAALIRAGLEACEAIGVSAVVVLGHPEYYPRFGFSPASGFGIGCEYEVPDEAFMALELQPGFLDAVTGTVRYHPAFDGV